MKAAVFHGPKQPLTIEDVDIDKPQDRGREVTTPRGRAVLVRDDPKRPALGGEAQHGEHEVGALAAVEPAGANDEVVSAPVPHRDLAVPLGPSVRRARRGHRVLGDGRCRGAVENVVGAQVTAPNAGRCARGGHEAGACGVHRLGLGLVLLGGVHPCPRSAVDDRVRPHRVDHARDRCGVGDVALRAGQADDVAALARPFIHEVTAELSGRAEHQVLQRWSPCDGPTADSPATAALRARPGSGRRASGAPRSGAPAICRPRTPCR